MGIVKADAYGHGSVEISKTLIDNGVQFLGVAFTEEGYQLRRAGIRVPILVFSPQLPESFEEHLRNDLDITLSGRHQIEPLRTLCQQLQQKARIHINVDTGMNRVEFSFQDMVDSMAEIFNEPWFELVGLYSHFSSSDEDDLDYTRLQFERFLAFRIRLQQETGKNLLTHIANSGAVMRMSEAYLDLIRPGNMLYGNPPGADFKLEWNIKQVMHLVSRVAMIKTIDADQPIGYNRRYYTKRRTKVAVIPIGYADGLNRRLMNGGEVLIRGKRYPIVGTVCMDQISVEIGKNAPVKPGDEVILFGSQGKEHISIAEVSKKLDTIPYEVTCWVSSRVERIHVY